MMELYLYHDHHCIIRRVHNGEENDYKLWLVLGLLSSFIS